MWYGWGVDPQTLLHELGITPAALDRLRSIPFPEARQGLEDLKVEARRRYRRLAGKYHPDRNPDQPEQAQEDFVLLGRVLADIEKLQVQPNPQIQRRAVYVQTHSWAGTTSSTSTSTVSYYNVANHRSTPYRPPYQARRVVIMRPT